MKLADITVEVRDVSLKRLGMIDPEDITDLKLIKRFNNIGSWSMSLPVEHPAAVDLQQPGAGLLVTGPNNRILMSGGTITNTHKETVKDPIGTVSLQGSDDMIHLGDGNAWPQPSNSNVSTQLYSHDIRQGAAESVIRAYVNANIGPGSPASRRINSIILSNDLGRGSQVIGRARFDQLGKLLSPLASSGGVAFDMVQQGTKILFYVYVPQDKTGLIRMDIDNDMIETAEYGFGAPTATRAIVAGQGQGEERSFIMVTSSDSAASEAAWGRKPEVFKDRRDTDDPVELDQSGHEIVDTGAKMVTSLSVKPSDEVTMVYGEDWFLGDRVTVTVDEQELTAIVTESIISIGQDGVRTAATIGDPIGFDYDSKIANNQTQLDGRVSTLEKNLSAVQVLQNTTATIDPYHTGGAPRIMFEDSGLWTTVGYPYLSSYTPKASDKVLMQPLNDSWIIAGRIVTDFLYPREIPLGLENGWEIYEPTNWKAPFYTKTDKGIVLLQGLIQAGTVTNGTILATLPAGHRPDYELIFPVNQSDTSKTVSIRTNGDIVVRGGWTSNGYVSFTGISFPAAGVASWQIVGSTTTGSSFINNWQDFGSTTFGPARYWKDTNGMVWLGGLVKGGNIGFDIGMIDLPSTYGASKYNHIVVANSDAFGFIGVNTTGEILWKDGSTNNGWISLCGVKYESPTSALNWIPVTFQNGWVNYDTASFIAAEYARTSDGIVHMHGLIRAGALGTTAFTLPAGYRIAGPASGVLFQTDSFALRGRLDMTAAGEVIPRQGSNAWFSIDGLSFAAER